MKSKVSPFTPFASQKGQAIVFIIGALATAFIFGVLASYLATTSIKKTTYTGQSEAALHAAEAGCRHALILDTNDIECSSESEAQANTNCQLHLGTGEEDTADVYFWATDLGGSSNEYLVPNRVEQDETVQIDLSSLTGSLTVYWCDAGSTSSEVCGGGGASPALEAAVIYEDSGEYRLNRFAFDDDAVSRGNNFDSPGSGGRVADIDFAFNTGGSITLPAGTAFIRLKPLYNSGIPITIALVAEANIPSQGLDIRCEGTVGASTRTVQVTKENPYLSSIFDYVLFSGTDITK